MRKKLFIFLLTCVISQNVSQNFLPPYVIRLLSSNTPPRISVKKLREKYYEILQNKNQIKFVSFKEKSASMASHGTIK